MLVTDDAVSLLLGQEVGTGSGLPECAAAVNILLSQIIMSLFCKFIIFSQVISVGSAEYVVKYIYFELSLSNSLLETCVFVLFSALPFGRFVYF